ncbi:unnamed protein product [Brachionus calyciflorus]|uniref:Uncharacterized protein n=1 Tax=Brachionus calyciflorus TaxID=104777 RepID=A0A813RE29_9BILA|nr:unnamed protein product [Brachionus calyciflorus]
MKQNAFILISIILVNGYFAQDDSFCDTQTETSDLKIPLLPVYGKYQAFIEKNSDSETEEIVEYYDGSLNYGMVTYFLATIRTKMYLNYNLNELLWILGDNCKVYKLNESISLTPFEVININGSQHIASPLNSLLSIPGVEFKFLSSSNTIRGIPVNQWQACSKSPLLQKTIKITASFSNDKKWSPAVPIPSFPSIPIEVSIQYKADDETIPKTELYSFMKFKVVNFFQEEDYFTPKGIYCPGRQSIKDIPEIPDSFAFSSQVVSPFPNQFDKLGAIETLFEEYNLKNNLFHLVYSSANSISNEIHDFNTGLRYTFDRKTGSCTIAPLTNSELDVGKNGSYVYLRDPKEMFYFENKNYQYVGIKRLDGINCDVWIGQRDYNGINSTIEWYFLSDFWNASSNLASKREPVPLQIRMYVPLPLQDTPNKYTILEVKYNLFGFSKIPFIARDYDISSCNEEAEKRFFIFELGNDLSHLIRSNLYEFQRALLGVLQEQIRVTILRITRLQIVFDSDGVFALFTLLDRAKSYGPVSPPKDDLSLEDAVKKLKEAVSMDKIQIPFESPDDNDEYIVPVMRDSLREIGDYSEGFVEIHKQIIKRNFSNTALAVVTIVATLVGLTIGVFFIVLHKSNKIKLPFL